MVQDKNLIYQIFVEWEKPCPRNLERLDTYHEFLFPGLQPVLPASLQQSVDDDDDVGGQVRRTRRHGLLPGEERKCGFV